MQISNPVEITYVMLAFMFLGGILVGALLRTCHLRHHATVLGGVVGLALGYALIKVLPMLL